jgi:hypothetical protein
VLSQDIPSSDHVDQGEEETWDTVGLAAERSTSPPPTTGEVVPAPAQQVAGVNNSQTSAEERRPDPSPAKVAEQPEEAQAEDEATTVAGLVDIASILGALIVTVVPVDFVSLANLQSSRMDYQSFMKD